MNNEAFYLYHNWCQDLLNDYESAEDDDDDSEDDDEDNDYETSDWYNDPNCVMSKHHY